MKATRILALTLAATALTLSGCASTGIKAPASAAAAATPLATTPEEARVAAASNHYRNFDAYQKTRLAFWNGMSRKDFEARTSVGGDGRRHFQVGKYTFDVAIAKFDETDHLDGLFAGYTGATEADVHGAYDAYIKATAAPLDMKGDLAALAKEVPPTTGPVSGEIIGWVSPDTATVLLREFSHDVADAVTQRYGVAAPDGMVLLMATKM